MNDWKEYSFSDLLLDESISYGIVQPGFHKEFDSIPIIRVNNIKNGKIKTDEVLKVDKEIESRYQRTRLVGGELLVTVVGSVGECAIVPEQLNGWNVARAVSVARIKDDFDKNFIRYAFQTDDIKFQMYGSTNDTVQPTLNLSSLKSLKFLLPDLTEQRSIASILSSLDDKIDLLHCQNKTLEAMAEALFRKWFVEEAKEEWGEGIISDFANHLKNAVHPQRNPLTKYHHYSIPAFDDNKTPVQELGEKIQSNKYQIPERSILFSKLNPHKDKRVWLILDEVAENSVSSTEFQIVKPKNDIHLNFLYGWLSYTENYNDIASGVGGTSGSHQRIDPLSIFSFRCPHVPIEILEGYNTIVNPLFSRQITNTQQLRILVKLRDTLLPKLMSGEMDLH